MSCCGIVIFIKKSFFGSVILWDSNFFCGSVIFLEVILAEVVDLAEKSVLLRESDFYRWSFSGKSFSADITLGRVISSEVLFGKISCEKSLLESHSFSIGRIG